MSALRRMEVTYFTQPDDLSCMWDLRDMNGEDMTLTLKEGRRSVKFETRLVGTEWINEAPGLRGDLVAVFETDGSQWRTLAAHIRKMEVKRDRP